MDTEEVRYCSHPVPLEIGLETIRDEQISLLLSDSAIRRMIRNGERIHYNVSFEVLQQE